MDRSRGANTVEDDMIVHVECAGGMSFSFDVSWAYWLRDTIPGTTRVITVDGARLFFPDERAMDLVPHLEQHWAAAAVRA